MLAGGELKIDSGDQVKIGTDPSAVVNIGGASAAVTVQGLTVDMKDDNDNVHVAISSNELRLGNDASGLSVLIDSQIVSLVGRTDLNLGIVDSPTIRMGSAATSLMEIQVEGSASMTASGGTASLALDSTGGVSLGPSATSIAIGQEAVSVLTVGQFRMLPYSPFVKQYRSMMCICIY